MISPERSHELLLAYAATRCGTAFRELVAGWTGMVHATALRVSRGQESLAEDVTQTVFSRLAAAPEKVRDARVLGAWLHSAATGFTLDALRQEARRRRREEISQQYLVLRTPESSAADAGAGRHELAPEIDGALSSLPSEDSQLLVLRFWQQQDWRSIGRTFGLSDDAAQKRMTRALERLRRILLRRGITSTTGALPAVVAGILPRDPTAAAVLKIISATQVSAATGTAATAITNAVMTAKTKTAIAALLLIAAAAPFIYQQQRVDALRRENQVLRQKESPYARRTSAAVRVEDRGSPPDVPAQLRHLPDPHPPERAGTSSPAMEGDRPVDFEAMNRGKLKEKLAVLRNRLSCTPHQELKIAAALEYGQSKIKISPPNVMVTKAPPEDIRKMEDAISAVLTPDQQNEYMAFRAEENANALEAVANRELSNLQSMTTLSPEQKDQAFAVFSEIASRESTLPVLEPGGDAEEKAIREAVEARWADRQEALRAILTPEQMALYQQAGSPYKRGAGG